jgi:hypothetical protein
MCHVNTRSVGGPAEKKTRWKPLCASEKGATDHSTMHASKKRDDGLWYFRWHTLRNNKMSDEQKCLRSLPARPARPARCDRSFIHRYVHDTI